MRKHTIRSLFIHRSIALPAGLMLLVLSPKCGNAPANQTPPNIGADANQALQMVLSQSDESQNFVARFKGKLNTFTPQQIEYARSKYGQTLSEVNSVVDEVKKAATGSSTLTEDEFKNKAKSAVDSNVTLNTLMERAVDNATDFDNFVLTNANRLPDSWTTLWRMARSLSEPQKQQFVSFFESSIRYKSWDEIKKK